jgi:acyl transferase domain-containing protein/NAD(P)-dependent dehydrogenase (short-subunit alcohol dehydrogenase family)/aryl carrier-like protein
MGRELLDASEVFRAEMAAVDELFFARAGWSVIAELRRPEAESRMALTEVAQPTLFALQLGLTAMLRDAGIMPAAVFGHSVGEVAAAFASGALSREQATDVIFHRSTMQARTAGHGKMAALGIGPDEARAAIDEFDGRLELAAVNGPRAVTVAGDSDALAILRDRLTEAGKFARTLPLNYAFHSRAMDPIREELLQRLDGLAPINAAVPFVSTVEGHSLDGASLGAAYWWRNIRAQVRFSDAVAHVARDLGITNFVEIGPHPVLRDYVLQTTKACDVAAAALQTLRRPTAERPEPESAAMWQTICACYAHGAGHPEALFERPARPASLPAYPWQRVRHWRGAVPLPDAPSPTQREHPLLGWRPRGTEGVWQNAIDTTQLPYLADHMVQGSVLFPAAGYIELGFAAARLLRGDGPMALENLDIMRPLTLAERPIPALQCSVDIADGTWEVQSRPEMHAETWTTHLRGRLTRAECAAPRTADLQAMRAALPDYVDGAEHYADARSRGLAYGPAFQGVRAIWMSPPAAPHIAGEALPRTALADIALPALDAAALAGYRAHPALLDCCLQVLITLLGRTEKRRCAFIPVQVERVRSFAPLPAELVCRLTVTRESERSGSAEIEVFDTAGAPLLTMSGARFKKVDFRAGAGVLLTEGWRLDPSGTAWSTEPVALPAPQRIAASLAGDLPALAEAHGRTEYHSDVGPRLDALIGAYAVHALHDLAGGDSTFMLPQLQRRSRIDASQAALLRRLVEMTVEDGWLVRAGGALVWTADRALPDAARLWRELLLDHPAYGAELVLAARHGEQLVPRLRGELPAPDGFDSVTEQLCETAPFRALATSAVAATLRALVAEWPAGRPIRVLELGGASGGLTAALLPMLPASRTEYVFSDASEAALDRASLRFSGFHCLRTAPFDVTADPAAQGLPLGAFDVILAGEALHAAQDPAAALHHACTMLAPGGWLIRIERGGSRLEDLLFTSDSPALHLVGHGASADEALRAAGFVDFGRITEPACAGRQPEQAITITQRPDGVLSKAVQIPAEPTRRWLLLTGQADWAFAKAVAVSLHDRGQSVTTMRLSNNAAEAFVATCEMAAACDVGADEIVHLAGVVHQGDGAPEGMLALQDLRCLSAINLVQAIKSAEGGYKPRLHLVTSGALAGPADTAPIDPAQAPLWGFGRVLANEHPDLAPHLVDLHAPLNATLAAHLADELLRADAETEVLLTAGQRFVNRMQPATATQLAALAAPAADDTESPFRLDLAAQGGIDSLYLRAIETPVPGPGQVALRVHAAGLNFRDVLWAMGMLPEEAVENGFAGATIGMECAGEVVSLGEGVADLAVGDRVVAFAASTFASHVVTEAGAVARLPTGLGFAEAATIPTTFLTAYYALDHLARLRPGESVLIHGAAGGVGLAALQIAKLRGAIVFASAGSAEKRRVLQLLGADHVLNSRSLEFADEIMKITFGQGVDVVLNSLAGEAITKNLQILRPFGRFLEIGKRDLYANSRIGLRPFRNNLSYFGIDADTLLIERPELACEVFRQVMALFAAGALHPLPVTQVPVTRAAEAFRLMQQSRHIGKIVLTMAPDAPIARPVVKTLPAINPDATWLVTGGLGGFGLATAHWLADQGVRSLVLVGRRGATTEEARAGIAAMEAAGARVTAFAADVTVPEDLGHVMEEIARTMPKLRGVVHAAMVLDDAPIVKLDGERLRRVLSPKLVGAWNLHAATRDMKLDHFILYSSGTTVVGNPGQANYVAANLYLESLAQDRRSLGLPAMAVAWGAIKDVGVLARNTGVEEMLQNRTGLAAIPASEALADLGRLMAVHATRVSVAQFNLQRLGTLLPGTRTPRFLPMAPEGASAILSQANETLASLLAATPEAEWRGAVIARLREHVGRVLGAGAAQVDPGRSLEEMGLDSLMAVELAEALEQDIGSPMSVMQLIQAGAVAAIADLVLATLGHGAGQGTVRMAAE